MENNYKAKYLALRMKFMESVDQAFRMGYEQGTQDSQMDQMAQAQQSQQDAMNQENPGEEGEEGQEGEDQNGQEPGDEQAQAQEGSELDTHINNLEQAVQKSEKPDALLTKTLSDLKEFKLKHDARLQMKKSEKAIKGIAKALKPKFKLSSGAKSNLSKTAKDSLSMQEKIVADVMKSFEEEQKKAATDISSILNIENLIKKD